MLGQEGLKQIQPRYRNRCWYEINLLSKIRLTVQLLCPSQVGSMLISVTRVAYDQPFPKEIA